MVTVEFILVNKAHILRSASDLGARLFRDLHAFFTVPRPLSQFAVKLHLL